MCSKATTACTIPVLLVLCVFAVSECAKAPPRLPSSGVEVVGLHEDRFQSSFLDLEMACQSLTVTARARVRGSIDRRRIDTFLWVGVDASFRSGNNGTGPRMRLESIDRDASRFALLAGYTPGFGGKDDATVLLSNGRWVVRGRSRELVELVLGLPLSAPELQSVLTGCPVITGDLKIESFDEATGKIVSQSGDAAIEVFIRRDRIASPWTMFAMTGSVPGRPIGWRADPGERAHGVLESVRLTSLEWNARPGRRFDLTVSFDRIQTPALGTGANLFSLPIPEAAETIAIDAVQSSLSIPLLAD